jgi:RNA polymerase sigma-70 factor (ECF subfamily)
LNGKIPSTDRCIEVPVAESREPGRTEVAMDAGDAGAPSVLLDQLPVLRAVASKLVRDPAEVEDLVQDVFERALRSVDRVDLTDNPRGWMVTILHNLHIDRCRQRARMLPHVPCDEAVIATPEDREPPVWSAMTTEDIRCAVERLPDELRDAYRMFALEGRSYVVIAEALRIPKATVGTRLSRARARLKQLLTEEMAARGGPERGRGRGRGGSGDRGGAR